LTIPTDTEERVMTRTAGYKVVTIRPVYAFIFALAGFALSGAPASGQSAAPVKVTPKTYIRA